MDHPDIRRVERDGYLFTVTDVVTELKCDCGHAAVLIINGNLRCWDCAEDEGVVRV